MALLRGVEALEADFKAKAVQTLAAGPGGEAK